MDGYYVCVGMLGSGFVCCVGFADCALSRCTDFMCYLILNVIRIMEIV